MLQQRVVSLVPNLWPSRTVHLAPVGCDLFCWSLSGMCVSEFFRVWYHSTSDLAEMLCGLQNLTWLPRHLLWPNCLVGQTVGFNTSWTIISKSHLLHFTEYPVRALWLRAFLAGVRAKKSSHVACALGNVVGESLLQGSLPSQLDAAALSPRALGIVWVSSRSLALPVRTGRGQTPQQFFATFVLRRRLVRGYACFVLREELSSFPKDSLSVSPIG